jgi:hypothetical protein
MSLRRTPFAAGIRIVAVEYTCCSQAKNYAGCYRLEDAPQYPFGPCDHIDHIDEGDWCTCYWVFVADDESPEGGWKVPEQRHANAGPRILEEPKPEEPMTLERMERLVNLVNSSSGTTLNAKEIFAAHERRKLPWWKRLFT